MSSTGVGIRSKRRNRDSLLGKTPRLTPLRELWEYLVEEPLVAVAVLWAICFPLMFLFLYRDVLKSAETMAEMTIWFVSFLVLIIVIMLSIALLIAYVFEVRGRRKRHKAD